jgi:hypothetical protein
MGRQHNYYRRHDTDAHPETVPSNGRIVDVQWGNKKLVMFYEDIQKRGELVKSERA